MTANKESYEGSTHSGDVFRGKLIGGVGDEQAGFPHGAVAHHHALYGLHLRREWKDRHGGGRGETGDHPGLTTSTLQLRTLRADAHNFI